jgi:hypothetical protein
MAVGAVVGVAASLAVAVGNDALMEVASGSAAVGVMATCPSGDVVGVAGTAGPQATRSTVMATIRMASAGRTGNSFP